MKSIFASHHLEFGGKRLSFEVHYQSTPQKTKIMIELLEGKQPNTLCLRSIIVHTTLLM